MTEAVVAWRSTEGADVLGSWTTARVAMLNKALHGGHAALQDAACMERLERAVGGTGRIQMPWARPVPGWSTRPIFEVTPEERLAVVEEYLDWARRQGMTAAQIQTELLGDADAMGSIVRVFGMLLRWEQEATAKSVTQGEWP